MWMHEPGRIESGVFSGPCPLVEAWGLPNFLLTLPLDKVVAWPQLEHAQWIE